MQSCNIPTCTEQQKKIASFPQIERSLIMHCGHGEHLGKFMLIFNYSFSFQF